MRRQEPQDAELGGGQQCDAGQCGLGALVELAPRSGEPAFEDDNIRGASSEP
jgi:hypothetical protein